MAWETRRHGGRYYTRSIRQDGRVVRVYIGKGERGEVAAAEDARVRAQRENERAQAQQERTQFDEIDAALAAFYAAVDAQVRQALIAAGYHQHKRGEWRRTRGGTHQHADDTGNAGYARGSNDN